MDQGILSVKLCEMEKEYGRLQSRIQLFQDRDHKRLLEEIRRMEDEAAQETLLLEKRMRGSGSPAAVKLAQAQLAYEKSVHRILREAEAGAFSRENRPPENPEPAILCAEYAADFATQSMNYALLAALKAMERQLVWEEKEGEKENE